MTIKTYLKIKSNLINTPFRIYPDGRKVYLTKAGEVDEKEFKRINSLPISLISHQKENADKTKAWLAG